MKWFHDLDPDDFETEEEYLEAEDYNRTAELAYEDAVMEKYYERN